MPIEIVPFTGESLRPWIDAGEIPFGGHVPEEAYLEWSELLERERLLSALDGTRIVGTATAFSFRLTVPGGELPAAGVTAVAVLPTHRRRGILRSMMRVQIDDVHARGEPLAILFASEPAIYPRFGYGLASLSASFEIERTFAAFRDVPQPEGTVRLLTVDEAAVALPPVYDAIRRSRPGFYDRSETWWRTEVLSDAVFRRRGAGPQMLALFEADGVAEGYARYRLKDEWDDRGPRFTLLVRELQATTDRAFRDLWRYLFDVDLVRTIQAPRQSPDPTLLLLLADPRRLGLTMADGLWVRLVDVRAALAGRSYPGAGSLVMELDDAFCPWNSGRWRLDVSDSTTLERTESAPDLALASTDLGSAYLGGFSFSELARAGRVRELRPGGLMRADALFATPRPPWCPQVF